MDISFVKLSDDRHIVAVVRDDGSTDHVELDSRSFLRHDLVHFAVEVELELQSGVWGSVAAGGSLAGDGLDGDDMALSERLVGPIQTMMRTAETTSQIRSVLERVALPIDICLHDLAERLHERLRQLAGHWAATRYRGTMHLTFPVERADRNTRHDLCVCSR